MFSLLICTIMIFFISPARAIGPSIAGTSTPNCWQIQCNLLARPRARKKLLNDDQNKKKIVRTRLFILSHISNMWKNLNKKTLQ